MNSQEIALLRDLTEQVEQVLAGDFRPVRLSASPSPEMAPLANAILKLTASLQQAEAFLLALSAGNLEQEPPPRNPVIAPFKQLQANLRHLTWQTQRIAAGDLSQQVDFLGEFSIAFNRLIDALREKEKVEERVRYLSVHDTLTDLYNRCYFDEEIARLECGRSSPVSIVMADLDGLKSVNDTLGHAAGDRLIKDAAEVMRKSVRANDVVARLGGDEFAVILPQTDAATAAAIVERIRLQEAECNQACPEYRVQFSIGIATWEQGDSLAATMKSADERMYQQKFARKESQKRPEGQMAASG